MSGAKKGKPTKKKISKKAAKNDEAPNQIPVDERQQDLPNVDPTKNLRELALAAAARIAKEETVGMIIIEFDSSGKKIFGWSGATPREHVIDSVELVKQLFLMDELISMRNRLIEAKSAPSEG